MAKILIVDDEKNIVNVIKEYCEYSGFETDVAYDGLEAYEKAKVNFYDCIIMDIMMPKMSGYEAVEEIKKSKMFQSFCAVQKLKNMTSSKVLNLVLTIILSNLFLQKKLSRE